MSEFTYERNKKEKLESCEWDNTIFNHSDDKEKRPRLMVIGDSISAGYRKPLNKMLDEKICLDGIATSKGLDNEFYFPLIEYTLAQQSNYKLIQFNNGLHGWHLSPDAYKKYYREFIHFFREKWPEAKLVLALTTPLRTMGHLEEIDERNGMVLARNKAVKELAEEEGVIINDLYTTLEAHPEYYNQDGVHLSEEAYKVLADQCLNLFYELLGIEKEAEK